MIALALLAQTAAAAPAPAAPPVPQRFSILQPIGDEPCRLAPGAPPPRPGDVTVCANTTRTEQAVPLPQTYTYRTPRPSNPELSGTGALAAQENPCATLQGGCQVGFGGPLFAAAQKAAVGLVKDALRKRPDKAGRVAIPLDGPLPGHPATPAVTPPAAASRSAAPPGSASPAAAPAPR